MNRIAIAFSSKDRPELTRRTIEPLLRHDLYDLYWFDGSNTPEGQDLIKEFGYADYMHHRITGGSCRAIVYALSTMLQYGIGDGTQYDYISLCENDVLLDPDWFEPTMELFEKGERDGLKVGAVSARTYEDRVLVQRDGWAIMHNLGAGMQIFTRQAAELILQQYRTGMTSENRKTFSILSGIDIGAFWAFRGSDHMLVADWTWDHMLAKHGLCSLALTPAKAEQLEDIAAMGLMMVREPVEARRDQRAFEHFRDQCKRIRNGELILPALLNDHLYHDAHHTIFPHQIPQIGGSYQGDWKFKWSMGYGCFSWQAGESLADEACSTQGFKEVQPPSLTVPIVGSCDLLISGGKNGGQVHVTDHAGYESRPTIKPEGDEGAVMGLTVPSAFGYRQVTLTALTPGMTFYGIRARTPQPSHPAKFDFSVLPPL